MRLLYRYSAPFTLGPGGKEGGGGSGGGGGRPLTCDGGRSFAPGFRHAPVATGGCCVAAGSVIAELNLAKLFQLQCSSNQNLEDISFIYA